jgi:hypothetical protein
MNIEAHPRVSLLDSGIYVAILHHAHFHFRARQQVANKK